MMTPMAPAACAFRVWARRGLPLSAGCIGTLPACVCLFDPEAQGMQKPVAHLEDKRAGATLHEGDLAGQVLARGGAAVLGVQQHKRRGQRRGRVGGPARPVSRKHPHAAGSWAGDVRGNLYRWPEPYVHLRRVAAAARECALEGGVAEVPTTVATNAYAKTNKCTRTRTCTRTHVNKTHMHGAGAPTCMRGDWPSSGVAMLACGRACWWGWFSVGAPHCCL